MREFKKKKKILLILFVGFSYLYLGRMCCLGLFFFFVIFGGIVDYDVDEDGQIDYCFYYNVCYFIGLFVGSKLI